MSEVKGTKNGAHAAEAKAWDNNIKLEINTKTMLIWASTIPDLEIREMIRDNRDTLGNLLLKRKALDHLKGESLPMGQAATEAGWEAFHEHYADYIGSTTADFDPIETLPNDEFYRAMGECYKKGIKAARARARRKSA